MSADPDVVDMTLPPEFDRAPPWARELARQQREDRHHARNEMTVLGREVRALDKKIGQEPDAQGNGGTGLYGKVADVDRRLRPFESLKDKAWGAAFMAVLLLGAMFWMAKDRLASLFQLHG